MTFLELVFAFLTEYQFAVHHDNQLRMRHGYHRRSRQITHHNK